MDADADAVAGDRKSTFEAWKELLSAAKTSIQIASMYWTLRCVSQILYSRLEGPVAHPVPHNFSGSD